jgi:hypothetical protein
VTAADAGDVIEEEFRVIARNIVRFSKNRPAEMLRRRLRTLNPSKLADKRRPRT